MSIETLLCSAREGDNGAWNAIVDQFEGLVWATTRGYGLSAADAADATQTTWLRLVEHLDRIQDPERLGGWLATTARHECLRVIRMRGRELPTEEAEVFDAAVDDAPYRRLITGERDRALQRALVKVGERCQTLLRLLASDEPLSYEEIAAALGMPVGAIGPTRARCLEKLRRSPELVGFGAS
jgi:RNA polymerase sigma factor (sigma-70 family)